MSGIIINYIKSFKSLEMGEPIDYGVTVSINPDTMKIVDVQAHPLTLITSERLPEYP